MFARLGWYNAKMKAKHYSPAIKRFLVCALYYEAKARGVKMTVLVNQPLTESLKQGPGWDSAMKQMQEPSSRNDIGLA